MYDRILKLDLPAGQSAFLWGARQTGKTTFLNLNFSKSHRINLLRLDTYFEYTKSPHLFREHILALPQSQKNEPIVVDEIQKIPILLNEVHHLIESEKLSFILCGSSARKLKQAGVNLLGGRAWRFEFFPLTSREIPDFELLKAFNQGLIPSHYLSKNARQSMSAYISEYLKEEIQQESLVRNIPAFARFLDVVGLSHGCMINYSNIAQDVGVDSKTVKEYFQILVDTLLGYQIMPYRKKLKREIISSMPKFYLFDVGIANFLAEKQIISLKGAEAGLSLEHFILMEILAYKGIKSKNFDVTYWRTKKGLEVDFILGQGQFAIEVKISKQVSKQDINGLIGFMDEHPDSTPIIVSQDSQPRMMEISPSLNILILPWQEFLNRLWNEEFL